MKLLKLSLDGTYKGLRDQIFDFSDADGNVIAFIGLNGSGKSQLLELIYTLPQGRGIFALRSIINPAPLFLGNSHKTHQNQAHVRWV